MSTFITIRRWERPDRPQPVYKGPLGGALWEAPLYVPIGAETVNSWRSGDRVVDRTYVVQTTPSQAWIPQAADRDVATWSTAFGTELASRRTDDRARLDVRGYEWAPEPAWITTGITPPATVAQSWPAVLLGSGLSYRPPERARLEVRGYEWAPAFTWAQPVVDRAVSTWAPAFATELASRRSDDRPRLDVRSYDWSPEPAWITTGITPPATTAQTWPAILFGSGLSYRASERAVLDVRTTPWAAEDGWIARVVDGIVATWAPAFQLARLVEQPIVALRADVRYTPGQADAWLGALFAVTPAQYWPAILALLASSTVRARGGDVRTVDARPAALEWAPAVVDRIVATWAPVFTHARESRRSDDRPAFDVRGGPWHEAYTWMAGAITIEAPPAVYIDLPASSNAYVDLPSTRGNTI